MLYVHNEFHHIPTHTYVRIACLRHENIKIRIHKLLCNIKFITVEPLLSGHPRGSALWPLNRGTQIINFGRRQMSIFIINHGIQ